MIWPTPKPAVLTAITVLTEGFGTYAVVSAKMPRTRPERFVRVTRVGGHQDHPATDTARILVECFGYDTATCENMCNTARAALRNAAGTTVDGVFVRAWGNEDGPVSLAHPDVIDMERWQFHGDFDCKSN